ncbi:MAG: acyl-[acyl-carrier-protein] thioesterase [Paludibacteraceae bacterium]
MMLPYRQTFEVSAQEVDFTRHQSLPALGGCLLNTAGLAAEQLGVGLEQLYRRGLSWVLSRLHIELSRLPLIDERITIETWVHDCGRLVTGRNFRVSAADGSVIAQATSLWSVINFETRRPVDLLQMVNMTPFIVEQTFAVPAPPRIDDLQGEPTAMHTVRYSDIDFNAHTNSMKYVQWMLDTLDIQQFEHRHIAVFDINYTHEAVFGEQIAILREVKSDCAFRFDLKAPSGRSCCKANIIFAPDVE